MSRRNVQRAIRAAIEEWKTKIRFLVRNPDFRRDLMKVRKRHFTDPKWETYFAFLQKWGLQWFPSELIEQRGLPSTPKGYETAIFKAMKEYGLDPAAREEDRLIALPPVVATEPFDEYVRANFDLTVKKPIQVPGHIPRPGTILNLRVDLSYPQDVLEAMIKVEIRKAKQTRKTRQKQGWLPLSPQRLRLDKVDFYLQVYDRAAGGEPYREIARALGSRKSTVQCAHVKAMSLIGGARPVRRPRQQRPSRAQRRYSVDEYITRHLRECQTCNAAEHFNARCEGFKSWATSNLGLEFVRFDELRPEGTAREH